MPNDPRPISESLEKHFRDEAAAIPSGKRGQANVAVTTEGVGAGISTKLGRGAVLTGWAGRQWKGQGWSAGARVGVVF